MDTDMNDVIRIDPRVARRYIDETAGPPRWGTDDCAMFAANILRDLTGIDLARDWRGRYESKAGAQHALDQRSGNLVREVYAVVRAAGWDRANPMEVDRPALGIVKITSPEGEFFACCAWLQPGWFVARGSDGVTMVPAALVRRAWQCRP